MAQWIINHTRLWKLCIVSRSTDSIFSLALCHRVCTCVCVLMINCDETKSRESRNCCTFFVELKFFLTQKSEEIMRVRSYVAAVAMREESVMSVWIGNIIVAMRSSSNVFCTFAIEHISSRSKSKLQDFFAYFWIIFPFCSNFEAFKRPKLLFYFRRKLGPSGSLIEHWIKAKHKEIDCRMFSGITGERLEQRKNFPSFFVGVVGQFYRSDVSGCRVKSRNIPAWRREMKPFVYEISNIRCKLEIVRDFVRKQTFKFLSQTLKIFFMISF